MTRLRSHPGRFHLGPGCNGARAPRLRHTRHPPSVRIRLAYLTTCTAAAPNTAKEQRHTGERPLSIVVSPTSEDMGHPPKTPQEISMVSRMALPCGDGFSCA